MVTRPEHEADRPEREGAPAEHEAAPAEHEAGHSVPGRLDALLVGLRMARSRAQARELIQAGAVRVDGRLAAKASARVPGDARIDVDAPQETRWVGRAARKLDAAFEAFGEASEAIGQAPGAVGQAPGAIGQALEAVGHAIGESSRAVGESAASRPRPTRHAARSLVLDATGQRCLDVGASTGGFTQVLLERGAAHVVALDVGHGQLVDTLAADPRVTDLPGTNIRHVDPALLTGPHGPFGIVVGDLSFISLRLVIGHLAPLLAPDGDVVLLIKPQFEVGRGGLDKHGVVTGAARRREALAGVLATAAAHGWATVALIDSPVLGQHGNREYLGWFTNRPVEGLSGAAAQRLVTALAASGRPGGAHRASR